MIVKLAPARPGIRMGKEKPRPQRAVQRGRSHAQA
jgi:hypothetical protein